MKRKRLDRDIWWSYNKVEFPHYYQMRVDVDLYGFHGLVGILKLVDGDYFYWDMPIAGKSAVIGKGMTWLQLIPDGYQHMITAMFVPKPKLICGRTYDSSLSVCYIDIIENIEYDTDGVAVYVDKYLDVIFTPQGDIKTDDRDELDEALSSGDITPSQYRSALDECEWVKNNICADIRGAEAYYSELLSYVNRRIQNGEKRFPSRYYTGG